MGGEEDEGEVGQRWIRSVIGAMSRGEGGAAQPGGMVGNERGVGAERVKMKGEKKDGEMGEGRQGGKEGRKEGENLVEQVTGTLDCQSGRQNVNQASPQPRRCVV